MKISIKRLRQIITEEVIKEELSPEIAAPAIAAMLQGMDPEATSDIFGDAFNQMYGEGSLEGEAERQAGMQEPAEEDFPTDYQAGGAYGDRPKIGFEEDLERIIKEELNEVYSEKQRRYMCAMKDADADDRPKGLSQDEAEKQCKGPIKKKENK